MKPCEACGSRRLWSLSEAEGASSPLEFGSRVRGLLSTSSGFARVANVYAPQPSGNFHMLVCDDCGRIRWYARELDAQHPGLRAVTSEACVECAGRSFWLTSTVHERRVARPSPMRVAFHNSDGIGHFIAMVSRECGRISWFACELESILRGEGVSEICERYCRCGASHGYRVRPVPDGPTSLMDTLQDGPLFYRGRGGFLLEICGACGLVEWVATEHDELRPGEGVSLVMP